MATLLETLVVALTANAKDFKKGLDDADRDAEKWSSGIAGKVAKFAGGAALAGVTALAGATVAVGKAAMDAWGQFDEASDALINATGASGAALEEMEESVKRLYGSTAGLGVGMGVIGEVMGALKQRVNLTGADLEILTGTVMNFARMTGEDAVGATEALTRTMNAWGVEATAGDELLNQMYAAGQKFGISFSQLSEQVTRFAPQMQGMGLSLQESMGLLALWEQQGLNSQAMLMGLNTASAKFAEAGTPVRQGLEETIASIQNAGSETEALAIAYETFGQRAGGQMVKAIQDGNLSLASAVDLLGSTEGALDSASERVLDFPDTWEMAMKQITTALVPLGQSLAELIQAVLPALTRGIGWVVSAITPFIDGLISLGKYIGFTIESGDAMNDWLAHLPGPIQGVVRALGDMIAWIGNLGSVVEEKGSRINQTLGGVIGWFGGLRDAITDQAGGALEFLRGWADQNLPRLQMIFQAVLGAIQGFWNTFGDSIMAVVDFVFGTVWTVIETALHNVMDLVSAVLQILTGDFEGGFDTILGIVERTGAMLWDIMRNLVGTIVDAVRSIDWVELGRSIIEGMINGITNLSQRLWDAARNVSQNLWDRMTGWWNTGSPSRKAERGLGEPIAQGIVKGIEGGVDLRAVDIAMRGVFEGMRFAAPETQANSTTNHVTIQIVANDQEQARLGVLAGLRQAGLA